MSCRFCHVDARHPCETAREASSCGNCEDQGMHLEFNEEDVLKWLRYKLDHDEDGLAAIAVIESLL